MWTLEVLEDSVHGHQGNTRVGSIRRKQSVWGKVRGWEGSCQRGSGEDQSRGGKSTGSDCWELCAGVQFRHPLSWVEMNAMCVCVCVCVLGKPCPGV